MSKSAPLRSGRLRLLVIIFALAITLTGCASEIAHFEDVHTRTLNFGDEIPEIQGNPILSISGGALADSKQPADIRMLESLGTIKYSVDDPYDNEIVEYEGVPLKTIFDQFGGPDSTNIIITATDDYQQIIPRADADKWPIILALKVNGAYAPNDHRGPSMIIYPYDQFSELEPTKYDQFWVWQIKTIEFS
ncbi:hypothetical protein JYU04_03000 [Dehalococcoides mccartyi]|nr:hypothetical protein [Dehalococcoides mccartyi]